MKKAARLILCLLCIMAMAAFAACSPENPNELRFVNGYYDVWTNQWIELEYKMLKSDIGKLDATVYFLDLEGNDYCGGFQVISWDQVEEVEKGIVILKITRSILTEYEQYLKEATGQIREGRARYTIKRGDEVLLEKIIEYKCDTFYE